MPAKTKKTSKQDLSTKNKELRVRLRELEEIIEAIRRGGIDALVVEDEHGDKVKVLGEPEHPYRILAQSIQDGAVTMLSDGTIFYINPSFAQMVNLPAAKIVGTSFLSYFPSQDHKRLLKGFKQIGHANHQDEFELTGKNQTAPVRLSFLPLVMDEVRAFLVIVTDISESKKAERDLQEREKQYRSLFDDSPISLWVEDYSEVKKQIHALKKRGVRDVVAYIHDHPKFVMKCASLVKIVDLNTASMNLYKINQKEQLLGNLSQVFSRITVKEFEEELIQLVNGQLQFEREGMDETMSGEKIYVSMRWSVAPGYEKTWGRIIVTSIDLTERKQAEEKINFQANLLSAVGSAVIATDLNGRVLHWNAAAESIYGWSASEAMGKPITDLTPDEQSLEQALEIMELLKQGKPWSGEFVVRRKDGSKFPALISNSPIHDTQGNLIGIVGVSNDITELKRMDKQLREHSEFITNLLEISPVSIYITGTDNQLRLVNNRWEQDTGIPREEAVHYPLDEIFAPETARKFLEDNQKVVESGLPFTFEEVINARHYLTSKFPLRSGSDEIDAVGGISVDITELKEVDEKLKRLYERFTLATSAARLGIWDWDIKNNVLVWDDYMYTLYGIQKEDFSGAYEAWLSGLHPDDRDASDTLVQQAMKGNGEFDTEFRVIWKDGSIHFLKSTGQVYFDEAGNAVRMSGVNYDISELKLAEQALRTSEQRYRGLAENFPNGTITIFDRNLNLIFADGSELKSTYTEIKDLIGKHFSELCPPETWAVSKPHLEAAFDGQNRSFEAPYWDNRIYILNVAPLHNAEGEIHEVYVVTQNITERKRAEAALAQSERRFRTMIENSSDGIALVNSLGKTQYISSSVERILGYTAEELLGTSHTDLVHPDDLLMVEQLLKNILESPGINFIFQAREKHKDGSWRWIEGVAANLLSEPDVLAIVVNFRDVTERKNTEIAIQEKVNALETLGEIHREISAALQAETILSLLCNRVADLLHVPKSVIAVREIHSKMQMSAHFGLDNPELIEKEFFSQWSQGIFPSEDKLRQIITMPTIPKDFLITPAIREHEQIESIAFAPLYIGEVLTGVLVVMDTKPREWSSDEIQMLELLAGQAGIALEKIRLYNQEKQRRAELTALYQLSEKLGQSNDFDEVLKIVVENSIELLHVTFARIILLEDNEFIVRAQHPIRELPLHQRPFSMPAGSLPFMQKSITDDEAVLIEKDTQTLTEQEQYFLLTDITRSLCMIPLKIRDLPLGFLILGEARDATREPISDDKLRLATSIGEQTSSAIHRTQLYKATEQQLSHLQALTMIDQAISTSFDLKLVLNILSQQAQQNLQIDTVAVHLYDSVEQKLDFISGWGFLTNEITKYHLKLGQGLIGQVALQRKVLIEQEMSKSPYLARKEMVMHEGFVSYCGAPLIAKGKLVGILEAFHRSPFKFTPDWINFYTTLAGQAAIAIDNAQLFENLQRSNLELERRVSERTAELNKTNLELERANRAKDEFLANMSHELRTPLNSILGLSESMLERYQETLNESQQRSLHMIETSGKHLLDLINDILDLSKIEAGKFDYYPQLIQVDDLCKSSITFVKSQAFKKNINLTYEIEENSLKLFADPRRLKQILVNLLTNAVKFTPDHGHVTLSVATKPEKELIKFSVIDTGIGIDPEDLKKIFTPFVQLDGSLNRQFDGTGLGLAITQKLTDLHAGSIEVESEVGKGSRFTINLPYQPHISIPEPTEDMSHTSASQINHQSEFQPHAKGSQAKILLVEDNESNILTIGEYLENYGYQIIIANDGMQAIKKANEFLPAVILMDIQMPVMDGLEATRRLRADVRFASTPIIALTALAMPGDRERCLEAGANEYMSKPVSLKELRKVIEDFLK